MICARRLPQARLAEECSCAWLDLMATCEHFLLAGLRREIGPGGDLMAAYRHWYAEQMEEHDRVMLHLMETFFRTEDQCLRRQRRKTFGISFDVNRSAPVPLPLLAFLWSARRHRPSPPPTLPWMGNSGISRPNQKFSVGT